MVQQAAMMMLSPSSNQSEMTPHEPVAVQQSYNLLTTISPDGV